MDRIIIKNPVCVSENSDQTSGGNVWLSLYFSFKKIPPYSARQQAWSYYTTESGDPSHGPWFEGGRDCTA